MVIAAIHTPTPASAANMGTFSNQAASVHWMNRWFILGSRL
jgi:hypothetical protein